DDRGRGRRPDQPEHRDRLDQPERRDRPDQPEHRDQPRQLGHHDRPDKPDQRGEPGRLDRATPAPAPARPRAAPRQARAQAPAARGAASIVATDVQRRIGIIADDSMLGRATPSPQLDAVAAYVAGEFRRFGLKPGGDSGTYFQHYPLEVLRFDPDSATIRI